jgi:sulfotransferase family protein
VLKTQVTDRLLKVARRFRGRVQEIQPTRHASSLGRHNRLVRQVLLELDEVMRENDLGRLEYLLGLLHLAFFYQGDATGEKLRKKLQPVFKQIHQRGQRDLDSPTASTAPLAYFVSYPRSGNTLAMRLVAEAISGQVLTAMSQGNLPFSKRIYPTNYPFPRLVKDHVAHPHYRNDRCVLVVRDGRDTVISLAFMTLQQGQHGFADRSEIADFIRWVSNSYVFGDWATHARDLVALSTEPDKLLVRYDDLVAGEETLCEIVNFFDPGNKLPRKHLSKVFAERDSVVERIKARPAVNEEWGFGRTFGSESMFHEWSLNRQGSSWRETWDSAAKQAFHETGATDWLIELGFESDPDWWRH